MKKEAFPSVPDRCTEDYGCLCPPLCPAGQSNVARAGVHTERSVQYLKMMTNMPMSHPFRRPAVLGELLRPLLLAPIAKGRSYFSVEC